MGGFIEQYCKLYSDFFYFVGIIFFCDHIRVFVFMVFFNDFPG